MCVVVLVETMARSADLDPLRSQLDRFEAMNADWTAPCGGRSSRARRKAGILHYDILPWRMDVALFFKGGVSLKAEFQHIDKGGWTDVYHSSALGLVVKLAPEQFGSHCASEFEQRVMLHCCVAPQYGSITGDIFGKPMHMLVAAYVGPSLRVRIQQITEGEPLHNGVPIIMAHLEQEPCSHLTLFHVILVHRPCTPGCFCLGEGWRNFCFFVFEQLWLRCGN
jgi:hypothetical protein